MKSSAPDGHLPTLVACFAHFDVCFMLWVLIGALGAFIFAGAGIDAGLTGLIVGIPILTGSLLRIPLGLLSDRLGGRRVGLALLVFLACPLTIGWLAPTTLPVLIVDGQEQPILRGDLLFRVVAVPAGEHVVEFRFEPASVRIGLLVSALALLVAAAVRGAGAGWRASLHPPYNLRQRAMLKGTLLYLANQRPVYRLIMRHDLLRGLAQRYVAGEELADGVVVAQTLNTQRMLVSLDHLGESVTSAAAARRAVAAYLEALEAISQEQVEGNISLKLTQLGPGPVTRGVRRPSAHDPRARASAGHLRAHRHGVVGLHAAHARYRTPSSGTKAFTTSASCCSRRCTGRLPTSSARSRWACACACARALTSSRRRLPTPTRPPSTPTSRGCSNASCCTARCPRIATHDERLIRRAREVAAREGIAPDRFEFQLLFGVRRDLQFQLVREGYRVRIYLPYGREWYPYLVRRLAERPANLGFFVRSAAAGSARAAQKRSPLGGFRRPAGRAARARAGVVRPVAWAVDRDVGAPRSSCSPRCGGR